MKTSINSLKTRAESSLAAARAVAEKAQAAGRNLNDHEQRVFDQKLADARRAAEAIRNAKEADDLDRQAREFAEAVGMPPGVDPSTTTSTLGRPYGTPWGKSAATTIHTASRGLGVKALVSGTIGIPAVVEPDVVRIGETPRRMLDLLSTVPVGETNSFAYLQQTVRTNNAAFTADSALKPTSVFTVKEVEDRVRVLAHLSEAVPERYLADAPELERFLQAEMENGLLAALEAQVVTGDGVGENLTGILNTTGIVAQTFATDVLTTLRKSLTALQAQGETPTAFVLHPSDVEAVDLLREGPGTGTYLTGGPASAAATTLWGLPVVPSFALSAGTGVLGDFRQARLYQRQDATLSADRSGDNFTKNLVTLRLEGRYGFAVLRPAAFASIDLTA